MKEILLVEPDFPITRKSKNHKNFLPIGLLKIASYFRDNGIKVSLVRGIPGDLEQVARIESRDPSEIWVTSLFTYWAKYVKEAVEYYKNMFPRAKIVVGGIFASLLPENKVKKYTGCHRVHKGVFAKAEKYLPAYDLVENANPHPVDYQIIHASRGCSRKCRFCGTWKIEPCFIPAKSIKARLKYSKVVFYDNNFLANPHVENILQELIESKKQGKILWCESQSGFDGRVLAKNPHLVAMIREAGFRYPRVAWDGEYRAHPEVRRLIDLFIQSGYRPHDISVFMLYNWDIPFKKMELKRLKCWEWKVQIADCRYRPLNQLYDDYEPLRTGQKPSDYYIHGKAEWTDALVKQFRKNIREQNICIRQRVSFYSASFERKRLDKESIRAAKRRKGKNDITKFLETLGVNYWFPDHIRYPPKDRDTLDT